MNRTLTQTEIEVIQAFRARAPKTLSDVQEIGDMKLKPLGDGLYRWGYQIEGTDLIVKINKDDNYALSHSKHEIRVWSKLLRSPLASLVPPLRYYNEHGVIVTDKIVLPRDSDQKTREKLIQWRNGLEFETAGFTASDVHEENIGIYNGRYVVSDLGNFYER